MRNEWLTVGTSGLDPRVVVPNDRVRREGDCYVTRRLAARSYIKVRGRTTAVPRSGRVRARREPNP
ncbi:hypothetical protein DV707_01225 [Halobellus limi]|uniref:Uncharacterized protein n=1 Tax=Halobellus limi TaxID=699433 RepID=A0A4D6H0T9_9EURY|nr:hypothetical protein DV707_01225 [Halobellus limi]